MNTPSTIMLAVSTTTLVGAVIAIVLAGIALTIFLRRKRRNVWRTFARKHGLRLGVNEYGPRIVGRVNGQEILLEISPRSSDNGPLGIEVICMQLKFAPTNCPPDLHIESTPGLIGDAQQAMETDRITSGNEAFDRELMLTGGDASAATAWLTAGRQLALLNLIAQHRDKFVLLDSSGLSLQTRTALSNLQTLNDMLDSLMTAAKVIELSEQSEFAPQMAQ